MYLRAHASLHPTCRSDLACCAIRFSPAPSLHKPSQHKPLYQLSACEWLTPQLRQVSLCCLASEGQGQQKHDSDLLDYITEGHVLQAAGMTSLVETNLAAWQSDGEFVAQHLQCQDAANLAPSEKERIYQYYLPVYYWLLAQLADHQANSTSGRPMVLGISAPQGCGKTTLVETLQQLLEHAGKRVASVSIDDFYLRRSDQEAVGAADPDNRMLQCRGNAGTHDLDLGTATLQQLTALKDGQTMRVPRYNKSAFSGKGDRAEEGTWPEVSGPLDVVLFEGWMLGFKSIGSEAASAIDPALGAIDEKLQAYTKWDAVVDSWLIVEVSDPQWVFKWRLQAEEAMWAKLGTGMSNEEVADFVNRYIPAYTAYLPGLYSAGPGESDSDRVLKFAIDQNRSPLHKVE